MSLDDYIRDRRSNFPCVPHDDYDPLHRDGNGTLNLKLFLETIVFGREKYGPIGAWPNMDLFPAWKQWVLFWGNNTQMGVGAGQLVKDRNLRKTLTSTVSCFDLCIKGLFWERKLSLTSGKIQFSTPEVSVTLCNPSSIFVPNTQLLLCSFSEN